MRSAALTLPRLHARHLLRHSSTRGQFAGLQNVPTEAARTRMDPFPSAPLAHPLPDGDAAVLFQSVEQTAQGLGDDGPAYRRARRLTPRTLAGTDADDPRAGPPRSAQSVAPRPLRIARALASGPHGKDVIPGRNARGCSLREWRRIPYCRSIHRYRGAFGWVPRTCRTRRRLAHRKGRIAIDRQRAGVVFQRARRARSPSTHASRFLARND